MSALRFRWLLGATMAALVLLAWSRRFVLDDAFISFRYAQHLARGQGLTWNVGEPPIEGFTNLLWTLVLAMGMRFGAEPVATAYLLGMTAFVGALIATFALARALGGVRLAPWVAVAMYGTNFTASAFATSGLETQAQACLLAWSTYLAMAGIQGASSTSRRLALSALTAAAVWLRLDSLVVASVLLGTAAGKIVLDRPPRRTCDLAALLGPFVVGMAALVVFKLVTFGSILPNTYYAKVAPLDARTVVVGVRYVLAFALQYALIPHALVLLALLPTFVRSRRSALLPLACTAFWLAYLVRIGGDFMELRMIVPVLPMVFAMTATVLFSGLPRAPALALAACAPLASLLHERDTGRVQFIPRGLGVESVASMRAHMEAPLESFPSVGRELRRVFGPGSGVTIAAGAAGAVPYYSELRTVDYLGLSDAWIARHGIVAAEGFPGHWRRGDVAYLVARGVNLAWLPLDPDDPALPKDAALVRARIPDGPVADFFLLVRSPAVDAAIARAGWEVIPVHRRIPE